MDARLTKCSWVIHLFAVAHTLSSWAMAHFGLNDEILLSLLTISMIVVVTQLYRLPLEVSAALAALCCFAGFYLGTLGGNLLTGSGVGWLINYSNEITTFVVTEIMGWATTLIAARRK
ncbi:MAG: hypothetical protein J6K24_05850 [Tidjanibacter sp.]|nr:hypothetical protein [Tidjanibacter sp.]